MGPPPAIGPDRNLGTSCSETAANDSELSNPDDAAAGGRSSGAEVESRVDTLAPSAEPEMARNVVAAAAASASATRSSSAENGTPAAALSGRT
jgi:hypothetical protein